LSKVSRLLSVMTGVVKAPIKKRVVNVGYIVKRSHEVKRGLTNARRWD